MTIITNPTPWANLPEELKQNHNWCVAGPDTKAPMLNGINGLYNASPVTGPWHDFDYACQVATYYGYNIGYIITANDGLTCIDLDVKDSTSRDKHGKPYPPDKWTTEHQLREFRGIVLATGSYAELSASGKGIHVWLKGDIGKGVKTPAIEIYSKERFIICTGNSITDYNYSISNDGVVIVT